MCGGGAGAACLAWASLLLQPHSARVLCQNVTWRLERNWIDLWFECTRDTWAPNSPKPRALPRYPLGGPFLAFPASLGAAPSRVTPLPQAHLTQVCKSFNSHEKEALWYPHLSQKSLLNPYPPHPPHDTALFQPSSFMHSLPRCSPTSQVRPAPHSAGAYPPSPTGPPGPRFFQGLLAQACCPHSLRVRPLLRCSFPGGDLPQAHVAQVCSSPSEAHPFLKMCSFHTHIWPRRVSPPPTVPRCPCSVRFARPAA